ncbi:hypothetical protein GBA52_006437 [Prunus armeniaca]|nr:hypothetical protein GBA52_006437 [Prunus armeniaca]
MEEMKRAGAQDALKMQAALDTTVQKCKAMRRIYCNSRSRWSRWRRSKAAKKLVFPAASNSKHV